MYSLIGGLVPGSSGRKGGAGGRVWVLLLDIVVLPIAVVANPFSSFNPFSNTSTGDPGLSPIFLFLF